MTRNYSRKPCPEQELRVLNAWNIYPCKYRLLANNGTMTPAAVKQKLQSAAVKVPEMHGHNFTQEYGYGRLDVVRLL